jgi:hypothetical protein
MAEVLQLLQDAGRWMPEHRALPCQLAPQTLLDGDGHKTEDKNDKGNASNDLAVYRLRGHADPVWSVVASHSASPRSPQIQPGQASRPSASNAPITPHEM